MQYTTSFTVSYTSCIIFHSYLCTSSYHFRNFKILIIYFSMKSICHVAIVLVYSRDYQDTTLPFLYKIFNISLSYTFPNQHSIGFPRINFRLSYLCTHAHTHLFYKYLYPPTLYGKKTVASKQCFLFYLI